MMLWCSLAMLLAAILGIAAGAALLLCAIHRILFGGAE